VTRSGVEHFDAVCPQFNNSLPNRQVLAQLNPALPALSSAIVARCSVGSVYESVYHWLEQPPDQRETSPEKESQR
jgi:hypothetical protein